MEKIDLQGQVNAPVDEPTEAVTCAIEAAREYLENQLWSVTESECDPDKLFVNNAYIEDSSVWLYPSELVQFAKYHGFCPDSPCTEKES